MTIASINTPRWLYYSAASKGGKFGSFEKHIGLHLECITGADPECQIYPREDQCQGEERYFCSMWRSGGFLMSFAVIFEMATLVSFLVIMLGGKATRLRGWSIIAVLIAAVAAVEFSCFSIVVCCFFGSHCPSFTCTFS